MLPEHTTAVDLLQDVIGAALATHTRPGPLVIGLCGAQGSGKSTLAAELALRFARTVVLSLDDLYLTRAARIKLACDVHPLLRTRGVPGTHDIGLGLDLFEALDRGDDTPLPRFDKASDDRVAREHWPVARGDTQVLLLEGWCVGARPQTVAALSEPVNALERDDDTDGRWRRYVNAALAGDYQRLFARLDRLVLLAAPGFSIVRDWRTQQESALRAVAGSDATGVMDDAELVRFIAHYERLTRHVLAEMPGRADLTIRLDEMRRPVAAISRDARRDASR
ncbi:kinase [Tahibacter sp.]|uniref:kinase n=1 Tax=Tahibacter sp. TaxID=2056211 RepID=UPI0028C3D661|nr:kinase [Tahibacter sp.]